MNHREAALRQWTERLTQSVLAREMSEQEARQQVAAFARDLGITTESAPERYRRIEQELRAAGAELGERNGRPYIKPGSADPAALSPEAAGLYATLTKQAPGVANVTATDREIFLHVATFGDGLSETEALRKLALDPEGTLSEYDQKIAGHRQLLERQAHDAERRAFEASAEGMKLRAAQAAEADTREAELESNARVLLRREAETFGIRAEHVESMSRSEVLAVSGIAPSPTAERDRIDNDLATNYERASRMAPQAPAFDPKQEGDTE